MRFCEKRSSHYQKGRYEIGERGGGRFYHNFPKEKRALKKGSVNFLGANPKVHFIERANELKTK